MQVLKYLLKWCTILILGLTAVVAIIVPGLAVAYCPDISLTARIFTSSLIILAACIFLFMCLLEWKP